MNHNWHSLSSPRSVVSHPDELFIADCEGDFGILESKLSVFRHY
jgi:hypothetical protein